MNKPRYSLFHSFMQKIAASRPGSWFFARTEHHFDRIFLKLSGGRMTLTGILSGLPVIVLTTTGAKTGLHRTLPVLGIRDSEDPNQFAVIAHNYGQHHHPAWYFNLKNKPHATCSIDGQVKTYIAHEASGEEYDRFWQLASETFIGIPLYKQRVGDQRIPIMILTPEDSSSPSQKTN